MFFDADAGYDESKKRLRRHTLDIDKFLRDLEDTGGEVKHVTQSGDPYKGTALVHIFWEPMKMPEKKKTYPRRAKRPTQKKTTTA